MISVSADPVSGRTALTATVTIYLDQVLVRTLSAELESAIRTQAVSDLKSNKAVQKQIAAAATAKLLSMLGVPHAAQTDSYPKFRIVDNPGGIIQTDSKVAATPAPDAAPKAV